MNTDLLAHRCDVIELPKIYQKLPKGMGFQKDSELVPLFNYYIKKFGMPISWNITLKPVVPGLSFSYPMSAGHFWKQAAAWLKPSRF